MSTPFRIKLGDANVVATGKTAKFNLPLGFRIREVGLEYYDASATQSDIAVALADMRLMVNAKAIRTHTGSELDLQINKVNGSQYAKFASGALNVATTRQTQFVNFSEPWRKDKEDQSRLAFNCDAANGVKSAVLEVDLATGLTTPALTAFATVEAPLPPPSDGGKPLIVKHYRTGIATGQASQAIAKVILKRNKLTVWELTKTQMLAYLTNYDMNPNSSATAGAAGYDVVLDAVDPVFQGMATYDSDNIDLRVEFANGAGIDIPTFDKGEVIQFLSFKNTDATGYMTYHIGRLGELD